MRTFVYQELASSFQAWLSCRNPDNPNPEWEDKHKELIENLMKNMAPNGSGFNAGTVFDFEASQVDRLVLTTSFEHHDEAGGYDRTTYHNIVIKPSLVHGYRIYVMGSDWRDIKNYISEVFHGFLSQEIEVLKNGVILSVHTIHLTDQEVQDAVAKDNSVG